MRKHTYVAAGLVLGVLLACRSSARADTQDVPGQVCEKTAGSNGGTIQYDTGGVRNGSTTSTLSVDCPIVLYEGAGRSLFIGGTDQSTSGDISCFAVGWDDLGNHDTVALVRGTGTYANATVGSFDIPDYIVILVIECSLPMAQTSVSSISDFWIQN